MIEISTNVSASLCKDQVQNEQSSESLSEEDQVFLATINKDLNKLKKKPLPGTVEAIMKYSRSL